VSIDKTGHPLTFMHVLLSSCWIQISLRTLALDCRLLRSQCEFRKEPIVGGVKVENPTAGALYPRPQEKWGNLANLTRDSSRLPFLGRSSMSIQKTPPVFRCRWFLIVPLEARKKTTLQGSQVVNARSYYLVYLWAGLILRLEVITTSISRPDDTEDDAYSS